YLSGGAGTAEPVLVTGGSCIPGADRGTLEFTPVNSHGDAWTIGTATAGNAEAINSCEAACEIFNPAGTYSVHAPVTIPAPASGETGYVISGGDRSDTILNIASDFPLTACGVFCFTNRA